MIQTAYATDALNTAAAGGGLLGGIVYFILIFGVFYFMFIRPQKKRAAAHLETVASLKIGMDIVTTSGMIGTITNITDFDVVIEVSKGNTVRLLKQAVAGPLSNFQPKKGTK